MKLLTAALLAALAPAAAAQWLHAPQSLPTGDVPLRVAAGDVDGDGVSDAVVLGIGTTSTFPTLTVLPSGSGPGSSLTLVVSGHQDDVQVGDVTGDGYADAVTVDAVAAALSVRPGNGLGSFGAPVVTATGGPSAAVALVDLDLDGALDAVAGNVFSDTMSVLMNDGAGALQPAVLVAVDNTAYRLLTGLVDADGFPDVVVVGLSGDSVRLMPGLGNGGFGAKQIVYATSGLCAALGDLNGDGRPDYVSGRTGSPSLVEVALNDGTGHFVFLAQTPTGLGISAVGTGDFDLDGRVDVVTSCSADDEVHLLRGDGAGGLQPGPKTPVEKAPAALVVADLSGDGRPDVAAVSPNYDVVHVLLANEGRIFLGAPAIGAVGKNPQGLELGDLDGDGDADAVLSTPGALHHLTRLLGDGLGGFGAKKTFPCGDDPEAPRLADIDLDGDLDAILTLGTGPAIEILKGAGNGNFGTALHLVTTVAGTLVGLTDVDGDLVPDALILTTSPPELQVWRGDGAGGLLPPTSIALPVAATAALGDLDDDGVPDLLLARSATQDVAPLLCDGAGGFTLGAPVRTGLNPRLPDVADVNGDGHADGLVLTGPPFDQCTIALLRGDGSGVLAPPEHVPLPELFTLAAGDVNGDGRADVGGAGEHELSNPPDSLTTLYMLEGDADGLLAPSPLANDWGANSLAFADLDGDGRAEVLAGDNVSNTLQAAPNLSEPHPWHDLGHALAGVHGPPSLVATGWAEAGTPGTLRLSAAAPVAPAVLFVSPFSAPTPFKGGLLLPVPPALSTPLVTDAKGRIELAWTSWPVLGRGSVYYLQAAIADAVGPKGASLSNAIQLIQP